MSDTVLKKGLTRILRSQEAGQYAKALKEVERLLPLRPSNTRLLVLRAMLIQLAEEEQGPDLEQAKRSLLEAAGLDERSPEPLIELGHYLFAVEDKPREALARFQRAARLAEELLAEALQGMASSLLELGKPRQALACLARASFLAENHSHAADGKAFEGLVSQLKLLKSSPGRKKSS